MMQTQIRFIIVIFTEYCFHTYRIGTFLIDTERLLTLIKTAQQSCHVVPNQFKNLSPPLPQNHTTILTPSAHS